MSQLPQSPLTGLQILVLRPLPQGERTAAALSQAGARTWLFPMLHIHALTLPPARCDSVAAILTKPRKVIYVSAHAATHGVPLLHALAPTTIAQHTHIAIGAATAAALQHTGVQGVSFAQVEDSESLLATPMLQQVKDETIILMRGHSDSGGRALLADTLTERSAKVVTLDCYERQPTALDTNARAALGQALTDSTHVLAGSVETLDALLQNVDGAVLKQLSHLLVPHSRVVAAAKARGFTHVSAVSLDDNKLIESLAKQRR